MAVVKAMKRTEMGSRKARALRAKGLIPTVLYGHGQDTVALTLNEHEVELAVHHGERLLEVEVDGKAENALIKDVQFDTFGQEILHLDLTRVDLDERVTVTVPIVLRGTPAGASEDGVLQQSANEVEIECMVRSIPDEIRVIVNDMKVGDSFHLRDLGLPEGATLVGDPEAMVCSVTVIAEEVPAEEEAEEGGAEPEVIGEKKEDAEDEPSSE